MFSPPRHIHWIVEAVLLLVALRRTVHGSSTCAGGAVYCVNRSAARCSAAWISSKVHYQIVIKFSMAFLGWLHLLANRRLVAC